MNPVSLFVLGALHIVEWYRVRTRELLTNQNTIKQILKFI